MVIKIVKLDSLNFQCVRSTKYGAYNYYQPFDLIKSDINLKNNNCKCEFDWMNSFCLRHEFYMQLNFQLAPTICICRKEEQLNKCTQFLTRCFAETTTKTTIIKSTTKKKSKLTSQINRFSLKDIEYFMLQDEKSSKTVLPQKQRSGRPYLVNNPETITPWATNLVRPQLLKPLTTTQQSFLKDVMFIQHRNSEKCSCCFNQPDEYCNKIGCNKMEPKFYDETNNFDSIYDENEMPKKQTNISCKCFNQTNYPIQICKQYAYSSGLSFNNQQKSFWDKNKFKNLIFYQKETNEKEFWRQQVTPIENVIAVTKSSIKNKNEGKIIFDNFLTKNDYPLLTGSKFLKAITLFILLAAIAAIFCGFICFMLTRTIYIKWKTNKEGLQKCQIKQSQQLVDNESMKKQNFILFKNNNEPVTISTIVHCTPNRIESILEQNSELLLPNNYIKQNFTNKQEQKLVDELETEKIYMV